MPKFRPLVEVVFLLASCCFVFQSIIGAQVKPIRRILILNEVGTSYPLINLVDRGVRAALQNSPYRLEFYREYMDTVLFPDPTAQQLFRNFYIRKYQGQKLDVIITVGPTPLKFMVETHQKAFPGVPIVFCVPNKLQGRFVADSNFTGVDGDIAPVETLDVALRLRPDAKRLVVVGGTAPYDRDQQDELRNQLKIYKSRLEISYLTDLTLPALLERLKQLPSHTIVLLTPLGKDAAGTSYISSEIGPLVVSAANAPVFSLNDRYLNHGEVGGDVSNGFEEGRVAGGMALRILEGEEPYAIPVVRSATTYMFDWRALKRWGLDERKLPPGSVVVNREPNLWEAHKPYIMGGISLTLAQTLLIVGLLWQRRKRKKVEKSLVERLTFESLISDLSTTFIRLPEKEVNLHLEKSLERIGRFLGVQRITLREFSRDGKELKTQFSWNSEVSQPSHPDIHTERCRWSSDRLRRGQALLISEVSDLPEEAGPEKEYLHNQKVLSAATIPLEVGGHVIGALSFSSTNTRVCWTEDLVKQLRVLAEIFSNALERKSATEALHASVRELRAVQGILREGEERFRLVANRAPVLIWMAGPDRLCTYFNDPWLDFTGRPMEKELGDGWMEDVHPEDLPLCFHIYTQAFERQEEYRMEYRLRRHDGEYRWVEDRGVPRFAPDGSFSGYIGSCVDITDRKAATEALSSVSGRLIEAQELERTRIARELHDDINQRLALLAMDLEQLKSTRLRSAELRERATQLFNRTSEISADIQGLSHRLHSSKLEYLGIAPAMKGFCAELAEQQKVRITFTHGDVPSTLNNEVSLCLFRILQEGLINAVKHSGAQHFEAQLLCAQGTIRLTIRDQGVGFDPGTAMNSRGLGLISMRERVSLVKGTISIASKPMEGTEIMVSIPVEVGMEESQTEFSVVTGAMRRPKVLLADDQPEILETVERLLEGQCEVVAKVDNGESMLDAVSRLDPDLVVLDISMPVLNGIEAAWRLKESGSRAKVIFLTVAEDPGFVEAAFSAGALGYVSKPHLASDVVPAVREVLQGHVFASQFSEAGESGVR